MKKNLTAIFVASSVAVMSLGSTLAAYGADEIGEIISSVVGGNSARTTESISTDSFSFDPATGTLTIIFQEGFDEWDTEPYSISREEVKSVAFVSNFDNYDEWLTRKINTIPEGEFKGCTALESVKFDVYDFKEIGDGAFEDCINLKIVDVGDSGIATTRIGNRAFKGCTSLEELDFEKIDGDYNQGGWVDFGESAFEGCSSLKGFVDPYIDPDNHWVYLTGSVRNIGKNAFKDCTSLKYVRAITAGNLTTIGEGAFEGCTELRKVRFSDCGAIETIGDRAFAGCNRLWRVTLGSGQKIGKQAFYDTFVEGIKAPTNLREIADDAFGVSEEYKAKLGDKLQYRYVVLDEDSMGSNTYSILAILSQTNNVLGITYTLDYVNHTVDFYVKTTQELPEGAKIPIPEGLVDVFGSWYKVSNVFYTNPETGLDEALAKDTDYFLTRRPTGITIQGTESAGITFRDEDDPIYPTSFDEPDLPEESSDPESSEPESSEPESSEPTPPTPPPYYPPPRPQPSEPESSEPESSEPESDEPESSEFESSEPESSDPTSSNSEDESNASKPADIPHNNSESTGSVPNSPDDNPGTGVRFLVPMIFAGAAIMVATARRRKMK